MLLEQAILTHHIAMLVFNCATNPHIVFASNALIHLENNMHGQDAWSHILLER